jgi:hypothetical protein
MSQTTCPTLYPSVEEFRNFRSYLQEISKYFEEGLVKVVPPSGCQFARDDNYDPQYLGMEIEHYYEQRTKCATDQFDKIMKGIFQADIKVHPKLTLQDFIKLQKESEIKELPSAKGDKRDPNIQGDRWKEREKLFWNSLGNPKKANAIYGGDISCTLFGDDDAFSWNLNKLDSILQTVGSGMGGVTNSMSYIGQFRSFFAIHVEDYDLYSINYLHCGQPKSWYSIPPSQRSLFEALAHRSFPHEMQACSEFIRHKNLLFSPEVLKEAGIKLHTCVQLPGEYIVTMPGAFHFGFNHGYNIAEATNFATSRWFDIGRSASQCHCEEGKVNIASTVLNRMETLWLRRRNMTNMSPVNWPNLRMRCSCDQVDKYIPNKTKNSGYWEPGSGSGSHHKKIFRCCACGLYCHWECIFGSQNEAEVDGDDVRYSLCHECNHLENEQSDESNDDSDGGENIDHEEACQLYSISGKKRSNPAVASNDSNKYRNHSNPDSSLKLSSSRGRNDGKWKPDLTVSDSIFEDD